MRIIRRGGAMWLPLGENRTLLGLLMLVGIVGGLTGIVMGELGMKLGNPIAVAGIVIGITSAHRLWRIW